MKNVFIVLACLLPWIAVAQQQKKVPKNASLEMLADYMVGSYNSAKQAAADQEFFDVSLEMRRIWTDKKDGSIWIYIEQAITATRNQPYRQRVYQLQKVKKNTFTSTVYELPKPERFIGAYVDVSRFNALTADSLDLRKGCTISVIYQPKEGKFHGTTQAQLCTSTLRGAVYATTEVVIDKEQLYSWDRGWDAMNKQVWGAKKGGYLFEKIASK